MASGLKVLGFQSGTKSNRAKLIGLWFWFQSEENTFRLTEYLKNFPQFNRISKELFQINRICKEFFQVNRISTERFQMKSSCCSPRFQTVKPTRTHQNRATLPTDHGSIRTRSPDQPRTPRVHPTPTNRTSPDPRTRCGSLTCCCGVGEKCAGSMRVLCGSDCEPRTEAINRVAAASVQPGGGEQEAGRHLPGPEGATMWPTEELPDQSLSSTHKIIHARLNQFCLLINV